MQIQMQLKVKRILSPKWVKRVKGMTTTDWRLSGRRVVLRNLSEMVQAGALSDGLSTVAHSLSPEPQLSDADTQSIGQMVPPGGLKALIDADEPSELLSAVQEECASLDVYLTKATRNARAAIARERESGTSGHCLTRAGLGQLCKQCTEPQLRAERSRA